MDETLQLFISIADTLADQLALVFAAMLDLVFEQKNVCI